MKITPKAMKNTYSYVIIKENFPELRMESTLLPNKYKPSKYAFIEKVCNKDGSESIRDIEYSNDIVELQIKASKYISWYNYPLELKKDMQGNISKL